MSPAPDLALLARFPRERTWLLPALDAVQRREGHVSAEWLAAIAAHLRVPASEVWGVASHYPEIRFHAPGRLVRVCTGVSCRISGGLPLLAECERRLGVAPGATAPDGAVTLEEMDCAFACSMAPLVEVDHHRVGRATAAKLEGLLRDQHHRIHAPAADAPRPATAPSSPARAADGVAPRFAALVDEAGRRRPRRRLGVGVGSCSATVGAGETLAALAAEVGRRGLDLDVVATGCSGLCWAAPVVDLEEGGVRRLLGPVEPAGVGGLLDSLARSGVPGPPEIPASVLVPQRRLLLERCGATDPGDIADAIRRGAYAAFARALAAGRPEQVIDEVRAAGLAGRGGAYFQTAVKWAGARAATGEPKWIVVNAEEGEPGIFKDRHLLEGDPHGLLEGVLLAAFAVGATRGIVYVHGEADLAAARMATALDQAREWGLLGERILGSGVSLTLEIRRGLGGFVLGEETALLESVEGRRAMPRTRPPFPVESGLWGLPTVINNVETLFAAPHIVGRGGAWFAGLGRGHGTKVFGLSGHLRRPGVVEVEMGVTLRTLLEDLGGGSSTGQPLRAAVVGGPSGSVVPAASFDDPLVPRGPVNPGTGGVAALDETVAIRDVVRTLLAFNMRESCGKCTPCREGTARLVAMLDGPLDGAAVDSLAEVIQLASLCGLGQAAPLSILSALRHFPGEMAAP